MEGIPGKLLLGRLSDVCEDESMVGQCSLASAFVLLLFFAALLQL
jgi:hypothetical protein